MKEADVKSHFRKGEEENLENDSSVPEQVVEEMLLEAISGHVEDLNNPTAFYTKQPAGWMTGVQGMFIWTLVRPLALFPPCETATRCWMETRLGHQALTDQQCDVQLMLMIHIPQGSAAGLTPFSTLSTRWWGLSRCVSDDKWIIEVNLLQVGPERLQQALGCREPPGAGQR